jgi:hypothetical protein
MFLVLSKLLETVTGRDDLERIARKNDPRALYEYLRTRPVWIPQRPKRFIDPGSLSEENLLDLIRKDTEDLAKETVFLWVLEMDGKKHLPIFSNQKRLEQFAAKIGKELNKVFGLGCVQELLPNVLKQVEADVVPLNLYSGETWIIEIEKVLRS